MLFAAALAIDGFTRTRPASLSSAQAPHAAVPSHRRLQARR
jgi:hypothetical protein